MDSNRIKIIVVILLSSFGALYLGVAAATAQKEALVWIGGGLFLSICLVLGKHIWILIPATLGMTGGLNFLPGSPQPWVLMTAVVGGFFVLRVATRQQHLHFKWTGLDWALLFIAFTVLQAFLRNPTGLAFFGGDVSGGKPYILFAVGITAYVLIGAADADLRSWRWAVLAFILFTFADGAIASTAALSPEFASLAIRVYSNVSFEMAQGFARTAELDEGRITQFGQIGGLLGLIACTFWRPVTAINPLKPWRGLTALGAVAATLLGGFRGGSVLLYINFCLGSILRRKPFDVIIQ